MKICNIDLYIWLRFSIYCNVNKRMNGDVCGTLNTLLSSGVFFTYFDVNRDAIVLKNVKGRQVRRLGVL